jgi:formylglycine-generating enzyme required for sulfatase activity
VAPGTDGKVTLTNIPLGAAGTTARKIYRTVANGSTYKYVTTISGNATTTYTGDLADASLGANAPTYNTTGAQQGAPDPTNNAGRTLAGTGPRTTLNASTTAGRSWYSPAGLADCVGNVWEWVAQFFGGLKTSSPGSYASWGFEGDGVWNLSGQAYNPDTGGYTDGLPSLLRVGGGWDDGSSAGVRSADAVCSPGYSDSSIGFRLAR